MNLTSEASKTTMVPSLALPSWKVLVVDDDPSVLLISKMLLKKIEPMGRKIEVFTASSEKEAREYFKDSIEFDLILLDVIMERNESGFELAKFIKLECHSSARILIRSGHLDINSKELPIPDGLVVGVISKTSHNAIQLKNLISEQLTLVASF